MTPFPIVDVLREPLRYGRLSITPVLDMATLPLLQRVARVLSGTTTMGTRYRRKFPEVRVEGIRVSFRLIRIQVGGVRLG